MGKAIQAYHHITADSKFRELERLREMARHNEAAALRYARDEGKAEGKAEEREVWQNVVANKGAEIARLRAELDRR